MKGTIYTPKKLGKLGMAGAKCMALVMVFDQEGKNIKLDEGEFNTVGAVSWETGFNTLAKTPGGEVNLLQGWLLETWKKWWPTLSK